MARVLVPGPRTKVRREARLTSSRGSSPSAKARSLCATCATARQTRLRPALKTAVIMRRGDESCSADPFLVPGPFPLTQHKLLNLAGAGLGQVAELHRLRRLEVRQVLAAERHNVRGGDLRTRPQYNKRLGDLAP